MAFSSPAGRATRKARRPIRLDHALAMPVGSSVKARAIRYSGFGLSRRRLPPPAATRRHPDPLNAYGTFGSGNAFELPEGKHLRFELSVSGEYPVKEGSRTLHSPRHPAGLPKVEESECLGQCH